MSNIFTYMAMNVQSIKGPHKSPRTMNVFFFILVIDKINLKSYIIL